MLVILLAMLMLEPLRHAMKGQYEALTVLLRVDPGDLGLRVLMVLICVNAFVQVAVHAVSSRLAKIGILILSVTYGLFFSLHHIIHTFGGEPFGIQTVLDLAHDVLAVFAIVHAWRWLRAG